MRMRLPEKEYLTLEELSEKWACSGKDLFHLIATKKLVPSVFFTGKQDVYLAQPPDDGTDDLHVSILSDFHTGSTMTPEYIHGIFYLPWATRAKNGDRYIFRFASIKRSIDEFDVVYGPEQSVEIEYSHAMNQIHTSEIIIFTREEIDLFEREHMRPSTDPVAPTDFALHLPTRTEKPLSTTERNTLLVMIAALCKEAGINPQDKSTAAKIERLVDALGLTKGITDETVKKHLDKIPEALRPRMK